MSETSIFLADDHAMFRDGLKILISQVDGFNVTGESGDGADALDQILKQKPDFAILDISIPNMSGLEIARQLKKYLPNINVIMLSRHDNHEYVKKALSCGVDGYISKDCAGEELIKCIKEVRNGNKYISPRLTTELISEFNRMNSADKKIQVLSGTDLLSDREIQVLRLIAEGSSISKIASLLILSEATVKTHRANIMKKLRIHKTVELVKYAIKEGILDT